jgi:hypothetical protein
VLQRRIDRHSVRYVDYTIWLIFVFAIIQDFFSFVNVRYQEYPVDTDPASPRLHNLIKERGALLKQHILLSLLMAYTKISKESTEHNAPPSRIGKSCILILIRGFNVKKKLFFLEKKLGVNHGEWSLETPHVGGTAILFFVPVNVSFSYNAAQPVRTRVQTKNERSPSTQFTAKCQKFDKVRRVYRRRFKSAI